MTGQLPLALPLPLPLRLGPGADLRLALEALAAPGAVAAAGAPALAPGVGYFVIAGIGSLVDPCLRLAGAASPQCWTGAFELISLSGTVTGSGAHLHAVIASERGDVVGGHVVVGNRVRTTAELLLVALTGWQMARAPDAATGHDELVITPAGLPPARP